MSKIDLDKLAFSCASGEVFWCGDYFGMPQTQLLSPDDPNKNTSITQRRQAFYMKNSVKYWLVYYFAADEKDDFLQVFHFNEMLRLCSDLVDYTVYTQNSVSALRSILRNDNLIIPAQPSPAAIRTYDGYLRIWRKVLSHCEKEMPDVWSLVVLLHQNTGCSDLYMDRYMQAHRCPVCGYYFSSDEYQCEKCHFDGINRDFISKQDRDQWMTDTVEPYKKVWMSNG